MKSRLGQVAFIVLFWGGAVLLVAAVGLVLYFTTYFEGIASILFLLAAGFFLLKFGDGYSFRDLRFALPVLCFALLGIIFDGAGNAVYNKPITALFCPAGTSLVRDVETYENSEGDDVAYHRFSCRSPAEGKTVKEIPAYLTLALRFFEYVLLGLILFGIYFAAAPLIKLVKRKI